MRQETRFNALPIFEIDGEAVSQSSAICRYIGKMGGLYPKDDLQALYCDEALDAVEDISHYIGQTFGLEGEALRAAREKLVGGWLTILKETRFNALPVLEIDGEAVTQSSAICRYIGKMGGLYPKDDLQALYCDEVMDAAEDISHHIGQTFGLEGEALQAARKKLVDGWLTIFLKGLGALLERGGGKYFADKRLTIADLKVLMITRWLRSGALDHVPKDLVERIAPNLVEHQARIGAEPQVVAYYGSRA